MHACDRRYLCGINRKPRARVTPSNRPSRVPLKRNLMYTAHYPFITRYEVIHYLYLRYRRVMPPHFEFSRRWNWLRRRYSLVYDVTTSSKSFFIALFSRHRFDNASRNVSETFAIYFHRSRGRESSLLRLNIRSLRYPLLWKCLIYMNLN